MIGRCLQCRESARIIRMVRVLCCVVLQMLCVVLQKSAVLSVLVQVSCERCHAGEMAAELCSESVCEKSACRVAWAGARDAQRCGARSAWVLPMLSRGSFFLTVGDSKT